MTVKVRWVDDDGVMQAGEIYTDCEDLRAGIRSGKVAAGDEIVYKGLICAVLDAAEDNPALLVLRAVAAFVH